MTEYIPYEKNGNEVQDAHTIQSLFNLITGKKQSIWKHFYKRYIFSIDDIKDIHKTIKETLDARHIISVNYTITIKYVDNLVDIRTDIALFEKASLSRKQVMSIDLDYDILLSLPRVRDPQSYKVSISLLSTKAIKNNIKKRAGMPPFFPRFLYSETGRYKIDYVDRTVAEEISACIEKWFDSLKFQNNNMAIFFQKRSHNFRFIFELTTIILSIIFVIFFSGIRNNDGLVNNFLIYKIVIYSLVFFSDDHNFKETRFDC